jgi:hypothetical protein
LVHATEAATALFNAIHMYPTGTFWYVTFTSDSGEQRSDFFVLCSNRCNPKVSMLAPVSYTEDTQTLQMEQFEEGYLYDMAITVMPTLFKMVVPGVMSSIRVAIAPEDESIRTKSLQIR